MSDTALEHFTVKSEFVDGLDYIEWLSYASNDILTKGYKITAKERDALWNTLVAFYDKYAHQWEQYEFANELYYIVMHFHSLYWNGKEFRHFLTRMENGLQILKNKVIFRYNKLDFERSLSHDFHIDHTSDNHPRKLVLMKGDSEVLHYGFVHGWDIEFIKNAFMKKYKEVTVKIHRSMMANKVVYYIYIEHWLYIKNVVETVKKDDIVIDTRGLEIKVKVALDLEEFSLYDFDIRQRVGTLIVTNQLLDYMPVLVRINCEEVHRGNCIVTYKITSKPPPSDAKPTDPKPFTDRPELLVDLGDNKLLL